MIGNKSYGTYFKLDDIELNQLQVYLLLGCCRNKGSTRLCWKLITEWAEEHIQ